MSNILKLLISCLMLVTLCVQAQQYVANYRVVNNQKIQVQGENQPLSMNFSSIDLPTFLNMMGEIGGVDVQVSDRIHGNIKVTVADKPWGEIFNAVLRENNLKITQRGNKLHIEPR